MVQLSSECWDRKVRYSAQRGGKGGKSSAFKGLPWVSYLSFLP